MVITNKEETLQKLDGSGKNVTAYPSTDISTCKIMKIKKCDPLMWADNLIKETVKDTLN